LIVSFAGICYAISLILRGSQPCSGDGCLIQIFLLEGIALLIPSVILALFIVIKSVRKKKNKSID